jgi:hypothetical protein
MFTNRVMVCFKRISFRLSDDYRDYLFALIEINLPQFLGRYDARQILERQIDELNQANDPRILTLFETLIGNRQYYRSSVTPRYDFDVPYDDLLRFLQLDGWEFINGALHRTDPAPFNLQAEEDMLILSVRASGLPNSDVIETHLRRSAEEYGRDNNNSMTNSRQALEQVLRDIAQQTAAARGQAPPPNEQIRDLLEDCGFLTQEEKRGVSGAYGFLSGGAHPGIADDEAARLGRNFALGACHYSIQKYRRWAENGFRNF